MQFQIPTAPADDYVAPMFDSMDKVYQRALLDQQTKQLQIQNQFLPQMSQADLDYKNMQTQLMPDNTKAALLGAQGRYAGALNQQIKNFYTYAQSPEGQIALQRDPSLIKNFLSTLHYLSQNAPAAANIGGQGIGSFGNLNFSYGNNNSLPGNPQPLPLSSNQVQAVKANDMQSGFNPNDPDQMTIKDIQNYAGMGNLKKTTDSSARQKNLYATNIDKTLQYINPDDLAQGAGVKGYLWQKENQLKSILGQEDPAYDKYINASKAADMLAGQIRQFYGTSIQPSMLEELKEITNPSFAAQNPKQFNQLYSQLQNILKNELSTYRDAMKGNDVYLGNNSQISANNANQKIRVYNPKTGRIE
jgi:hypothetical protein